MELLSETSEVQHRREKYAMNYFTHYSCFITTLLALVTTSFPHQLQADPQLPDLSIPPELFLPELVLPQLTLPISAEPARLTKARHPAPIDHIHYEYNGETKTLNQFIADAKVRSFLVLKDGEIVYERNIFPYSQWSLHQSWSISKQILSAVIGIAIEEGAIDSIEDPMDRYDARLAENGFAGVSFRQALQMSSGILYDEKPDRYNLFMEVISNFYSFGSLGSNLVENTITPELTRAYKPDSRWQYASINSQALSMALSGAINRPYHEYLYEKLLSPLGVSSETKILVDGDYNDFGFCCIYATSRTYAAIGEMYLNDGYYNGKQIVPAQWVRLSTTFDDPTSWKPEEGVTVEGVNEVAPFGFAYHWWPLTGERGDYTALGVYGQSIHVLPKQNTVIVRLSGDYDSNNSHRVEAAVLGRTIADFLD
jgi:CubicO group peptidase (beta-lactamase class C family)